MLDTLSARANALRDRYKVLEGVPGSGYHDNDRNLARTDLFLAPQKNGLQKCSEQLVFFTDFDDEIVYFVGDDADKAMDLIQKWFESAKKEDIASAPGTTRKLFLKTVPKLSVKDGVLAIWLCDWNDVASIFEEAKVGFMGLPFNE